MKVFALVAVFLMTVPAMASDYEAIAPIQIQPKAEVYGPLSCADVASELAEYREGLNEVIRQSVDTHYDVARVVRTWHDQLSRFEGRQVTIEYGAFDAIGRSARTARSNAEYLEDTFDRCDERFVELIDMVAACIL